LHTKRCFQGASRTSFAWLGLMTKMSCKTVAHPPIHCEQMTKTNKHKEECAIL
jgi:hypothetical protein